MYTYNNPFVHSGLTVESVYETPRRYRKTSMQVSSTSTVRKPTDSGDAIFGAARNPAPKATKLLDVKKIIRAKLRLDQFKNCFRWHQLNAIHAMSIVRDGQINLPTATGKSYTQQYEITKNAIAKSENGELGAYVIASHRLALNRQNLDGLVRLFKSCGLPFDVIAVSSDRQDEDKFYRKHDLRKLDCRTSMTTNQNEVLAAVTNAHSMNRNAIVVVTYNSLDKLKLLKRIDVIAYDEAHSIVGATRSDDNFESKLVLIQSLNIIDKQFFFTATPKISGTEYGMLNRKIYSDIIYTEPAGVMVQSGDILMPKLHFVKTAMPGDHWNHAMIAEAITKGYIEHKRRVQHATKYAKDLGAKLLVSMPGTLEIGKMLKDLNFLRWCFRRKIKLYTFSSELGYMMFDTTGKMIKVSRTRALASMHALRHTEDALILHVDILTEGIDLPDITGVMPFRELQTIKMLQLLGRAMRLVDYDRKALYSGSRSPKDRELMQKPYAWILLPELNGKSQEANQRMRDIVWDALEKGEMSQTFEYADEYVGCSESEAYNASAKKDERQSKIVDLVHLIESFIITGDTGELSDEDFAAALARALCPDTKDYSKRLF